MMMMAFHLSYLLAINEVYCFSRTVGQSLPKLYCFRPQLLSLDMSHNNLCDLMDVVKKLATLPKLRNLVLQGNPLAVSRDHHHHVLLPGHVICTLFL